MSAERGRAMQQPDSKPDSRKGHTAENTAGARIIPFRQKAAASARGSSDDADAQRAIIDEDRARMRQNIASAAVVIVLLLLGGWCIAHLRASLRVESCLEAGYRNCSVQHW